MPPYDEVTQVTADVLHEPYEDFPTMKLQEIKRLMTVRKLEAMLENHLTARQEIAAQLLEEIEEIVRDC